MNSKEITLPSGGKCRVRKITNRDYMESGKEMRTLWLEKVGEARRRLKQAKDGAQSTDAEGITEKDLEFGLMNGTIALLRCCGPIAFPDGRVVNIVNKPWHLVDELKETTIELIDDADANEIIKTVTELSKMTKEAAQNAATFPDSPGKNDPAQDGEGVRQSPN